MLFRRLFAALGAVPARDTHLLSVAAARNLHHAQKVKASRPGQIPRPPHFVRPFSSSRASRAFRRPSHNHPPPPPPAPPESYDPRLSGARPLISGPGLRRMVRSPRTHTVVVVAVLGAFAFYFLNVETVPVSGRRRFNCYGDASVREVGELQYRRLLYDLEQQGGRFLSSWDWRTAMVQRVMARLIPVSGMADEKWEVKVIDDPGTANAFVLPGGKVFVFSGLFNVVRTESDLAAVLGHEIAHNLADHVAERLSASIGTNILLHSLLLLSLAMPPLLLAVQFFGGGMLDVMFSRPMGRLQESEADYIGLMMMAEACYDPTAVVDFWRRMDKMQGMQPPEWLSTHPSNQNRVDKIQQWLPKALERRQESNCKGTQGFAEMFRKAMSQGVVLSI